MLINSLLLLVFALVFCTLAAPAVRSQGSGKNSINDMSHQEGDKEVDLAVIDWSNIPLEMFLPEDRSTHQLYNQVLSRNGNNALRFGFDSTHNSEADTISGLQSRIKSSENKRIGSVYEYIFTFFSFFISSSGPSEGQLHRSLQTKGTNCILIERGNVPRYYDCNGCVIDEAQACIDDLRANKSLNVHPDCAMKSASVRYLGQCCPRVELINGRYNLQYLSAGYPMALRCLHEVGCGSSVLFTQLERECLRACPQKDVRSGSSVCYATFNAGFRLQRGPQVLVVSLLVIGMTLLWK